MSRKGALYAPCHNLAISVCIVQLWMYNTCVGCRAVLRARSSACRRCFRSGQAWPRVHGRRPVLRPVRSVLKEPCSPLLAIGLESIAFTRLVSYSPCIASYFLDSPRHASRPLNRASPPLHDHLTRPAVLMHAQDTLAPPPSLLTHRGDRHHRGT